MLPYIQNSSAGVNKWEPLYKNLFEVEFTIPEALTQKGFSEGDVALLSQHIQKISGLSALTRTASAGVTQKFMGTNRTYVNSGIDDTTAAISVTFALNLRNDTDNFIYKLFRAWARLNYDISTGERSVKSDYCANCMKIKVGNKAGVVYRSIVFKDVMLDGDLEYTDEYSYDSNSDILELTVKFKSDWWEDLDA